MTHQSDFFVEKGATARYYRLRTIMDDRGIKTFADLGAKLGVSRSLISQIAHGHKDPSRQLRLAIASVLNCDSYLIFDSQEKKEGGEE